MRSSRSPRRALALYLVLLAGPTLVLLGLGLRAVQQQRQAILALADANRRLTEQRFVDLLGRRLTALAGECLASPDLADIATATDWTAPVAAHAARAKLSQLQQRHPVVAEFFAMTGGAVHLPRSAPSLPVADPVSLSSEPPPARARLATLLRDADDLERSGRWLPALQRFRAVAHEAASGDLRAFALSRVARCAERLGDVGRARDAYLTIATSHLDAIDAAGRPRALVAAVELVRLVQSADHGYGLAPATLRRTSAGRSPRDEVAATLAALRLALDAGRWDLTEDEAAYFDSHIGHPSGGAAVPVVASRRGALVRALRQHFRHYGPLTAGQVYSAAFDGHQTFYAAVAQGTGPGAEPLIMGLDTDLGYVRDRLASEAQAAVQAAAPPTLADAGAGRTTFRTVLPFWSVAFPAASAGGTPYEGLVFGAATAAVLGLLVLGVVFLVRDVARERATAQLRTDLVGGVSHELKTPLSVIRLYSEMLAGDPDAPRDERRSFYEVISAESLRLSHLIERVLDFSRVTRGHQEYVLQPLQLGPIVANVVASYRHYLQQQGFAFDLDVSDDGLVVAADEEAVARAIVSLLENAMKYCGQHRHVAVRVSGRGGDAIVEVTDRGIGIAGADRVRLFERFYRGQHTGGRGGYGLGLYLVAHVMKAHGGRVEVDSEEGRGSTFRLVFPVVSPPAGVVSEE